MKYVVCANHLIVQQGSEKDIVHDLREHWIYLPREHKGKQSNHCNN